MSRLLASLLLALLLPSPVDGSAASLPAAVPPLVRSGPSGLVAARVGPTGPTLGAVPVGHGVWPLDPRPTVTRGFDPPETAYGRGHRGVDLLGHAGQAVRTSLAGTVTFAAPLAGRGVVVVDHGTVRTTYQPVRASVAVGQHVGRGAVIGSLVAAGSHCAPRACLHWGLLRATTYLDPLLLVGGVPVRLLPLSGPTLP